MLCRPVWAVLIFFVVACRGTCPDNYMKPHPQGLLRIACERGVDHLNLLAATTPADDMAAYLLYEGLLAKGTDGTLTLALAKSVSVSADGLLYTFKLRPAWWSNGDPVTAADFAYTWKAALAAKNSSVYAHQLWPIKYAQAVQAGKTFSDELGVFAFRDDTLIVELEKPFPNFLSLLTTPAYFAMNSRWAQAVAHTEDTTIPTNGPFIVTQWVPGGTLITTKNPDYWNASAIQLTAVHMVAGNSESAFKLFSQDDLDWMGTPLLTWPDTTRDTLQHEGCLQTIQVPVLSTAANGLPVQTLAQEEISFRMVTIEYIAKPRVRAKYFTYNGCLDVRHAFIARYNIDP